MQIFVKLAEIGGTHVVQLPADATLDNLRGELRNAGQECTEGCFFTCGSKLLQEGQVLSGRGVEDECTVEVHLRLLGGGKKRKKKTYTKPKKPKHKRQHEKLRALKMYKVEGQKVIRCKKECPTCGPGVFMATHFDRIYCGRCTTTYLYEGGDAE